MKRFLVAVVISVAVPYSLGTNRPLPVQQTPPDCRQILQKAAKACLDVKQVEYIEEQRIGAGKEPQLVSRVRQARAKVPQAGFMPGKFVVEGRENREGGPAREYAFAYDGSALRILTPQEKTVRVVKSPTAYTAGSLLAGQGLSLIGVPQLTQDDPFQNLLAKDVTYSYEGTRTIQGTVCHAIATTTTVEHPALGKRSITSTWFIGRDDSLPRGSSTGPMEKTIRIVAVNQPAAQEDYVVATPAGFAEKLVTGNEPRTTDLLPVGSPAPDWKLTDPSGRAHSLKEYRGKVVVMDFWGTWCYPCQKAMPSIQATHDKFKNRGVKVFGVAVADEEGKPADYMKRKGYTYTLLLKGDAVAAAYKAAMLPTLYVIGPDGKIVHAESGLRSNLQAELSTVLERALK